MKPQTNGWAFDGATDKWAGFLQWSYRQMVGFDEATKQWEGFDGATGGWAGFDGAPTDGRAMMEPQTDGRGFVGATGK